VPPEVCSLPSSSVLELPTFFASILAAVFFCTYDTLKRVLPTPPHLAPVNHMLSASVGEVVRGTNTRLRRENLLTVCTTLIVEGSLSHQGTDRSDQNTVTDIFLRRAG
jgi:hypothetical protein